MCVSVAITTTLIYIVITKQIIQNTLKMLIHTVHQGTVLGQDMKSTFECLHIKKSLKVPKG